MRLSDKRLASNVIATAERRTASDIKALCDNKMPLVVKRPPLQSKPPFATGAIPEYSTPSLMISPSERRKPSPSNSPVKYGPCILVIRLVPDIVLNLRIMVSFQVKVFPENEDELGGVAVRRD